ncbi:MAG TPA: PDZ domain-containing protein [Longimicrobiales bacterium]
MTNPIARTALLTAVLAGCASAGGRTAPTIPGASVEPAGTPPAARAAQPSDTVRYEVSFPNAARHEAEIVVEYRNLPARSLELRMSRSSPGRYALHEFAKNVYAVRAVDGRGRELTVTRPNPHQWDVAGHDGTVRVSYTLFGDHADGTYAGIDVTHAHMNMPATFMWARDTGDRPIAITFRAPAGSGWRAATQLKPTADAMRYVAPHLQYFMDSPTQLSAHAVREWQETSGGRTQTIRVALHHLGTDAQLDEYAGHVRRIVREQAAVFGALPEFDFGTYTFIADYLPWVRGDGMEHRNSTILTSTGSLANMLGVLGTVSHEFFHAWNVERIRPRSLEPFDFEEANMSGELWFAEGFTSYYGPMTLRRAGIYDDARYASALTGTVNTVLNAPGRGFFSPVEMSMQAPFVDAATSVDAQNRANTFISYYTWGAGIGLALDLAIRSRFPGRSLDDFMRAMWQKHGVHQQNFTPVRPYAVDDLRVTLGETLGDTAFANDFFRRYITGREAPDFATLLAQAGLRVRPARAGTPTIGAPRLNVQDGSVVIAGPVLIGTSLYEAGAAAGDRIVSLDGRAIDSGDAVAAVVSAKRPGEVIEITLEQRGQRRTARVAVREDPSIEVVTYEAAGLEVTDAIRRFRSAWLGGRSN